MPLCSASGPYCDRRREAWSREFAQVGSPGNVSSVVDLGQGPELIAQPGIDQGRPDRRQVDADPLAAERFGAHACGRAAAARVEDDVALVAVRLPQSGARPLGP